ncbi:hypothetical protein GCM10027562_12880 [Arthrobacter pigmenti]
MDRHGGGQDMDHGDHDGGHAGHDMGGHDHMHHGGEVAGLAMAGTAPDRDGLELDELKVTLGPVLPGWPTGLVLKASMQGDVLTDVSLSWVDGVSAASPGQPADSEAAVPAVDALAWFLLVAGWPWAARQARSARTALSSGNAAETRRGQRMAAAVARRITRSRSLAWSVRGMGYYDAGATNDTHPSVEEAPLSRRRSGDVLDRVRVLAAVAAQEEFSFNRVDPERIEFLLEGIELAAARLIVASFIFEPAPTVLHNGAGHD